MEVFGKRLKWLREKGRFSQQEVADLIGMSVGAVQKFEYGKREPSYDVLCRLCDIYNVSADFILGRSQAVNELKDLEHKIIALESILSGQEEMLMEILNRSNMLEMDIQELKRREMSKESIVSRKKELDVLQERKVYTEKQITEIKQEHASSLKKYIEEILNIPDSRVYMDEIVKRYAPYSGMLQMDLFDNYSIYLSGKKIGFVGYFGEYSSETIASFEKLKLLDMLNGE